MSSGVVSLLSDLQWPLILAVILWLTVKTFMAGAKRVTPLPPGPKGLPFIGNALQLSTEKSWIQFRDWARQYGDVTYLDAMGQPIIILNTVRAIQDLLVRRAAIYSDRPEAHVEYVMGIDQTFGIMHYGPRWREHRRTFHHYFNQMHTPVFHPIIEEEMPIYLRQLLREPENFRESTRLLFGNILIRISYGFEDRDHIKSLVHTIDKFLRDYFEYAAPGRVLVSVFPKMRYVPEWFPGAAWKRTLKAIGAVAERVFSDPFEDTAKELQAATRRNPQAGVAQSLIGELPEKADPNYARRREIARNVAGVAYLAGSDTVTSAALGVINALASHKEVLRKGQAEIDAVVGKARLPSLKDVAELPYIQAIVKETLRWHTIAPLCLPHSVLEDDIYDGYMIPAGSIVMPNSWAVLHDPENFDNPEEFRPERYLKDGKLDTSLKLDPEEFAFGYGRRICPGRHLASEILTIMVASLIAVYDIKPALDDTGKDIPVALETDSSMVLAPLPFKCTIAVRSKEHAELLSQVY